MAEILDGPVAERTVLHLRPVLTESARVRGLLRELAAKLSFSDDRTFDIQVAVSEAVANAIEHAHGKGEIEVRLEVFADRLEVSVHGRGEFHLPGGAGDRVHRGLGLPLMAKLTDHLALYSVADGGTLVALTFYLPEAVRGSSTLPPSMVETLKQQAEALARERQRLLDVLETLPDMVCLLTPDRRILFANRAFRQRYGELEGQACHDGSPEGRPPCGHPEAYAVLSTGQPRHWELTLEDGRVMAVHSFPFTDVDGSPLVLEIDVDVTEQRETERGQHRRRQELEQLVDLRTAQVEGTQDRLSTALHLRGMAHWDWDPVDDRLSMSDTGAEVFGLLPGAALGSGEEAFRLVHPQDVEEHRRQVQRAVQDGGSWHNEYRIIRPRDGRTAWLEERGSAARDPETGQVHLSGLVWDITTRKKAEEARQQSEEKYRSLFDAIDEGFCIIEVLFDGSGRPNDYRFLEVNEAFGKHTGLENSVGRRVNELAPQHEESWFEIYGQVALTGQPVRFQQTAESLGRFYDVYAFRTGDPEQHHVAVLFNDRTESRLVEEKLRRSAERQEFLLELSDAVRRLALPVEIEGAAARVLGRRLGVDRAFYAEVIIKGGVEYFDIESDYRSPGTASVVGRHRVESFGPERIATYRQGQPIAVEDVETDPVLSESEREAYRSLQVRAYVGVPLLKKGEFVGVFAVHQRGPRAWTAEEIRLVEETADRTWAAVEQARAEAALRRSERKYRALADENERLYRQQLEIAESLQGALLHIPSEIGPVRLGHLYRSATEAARVGGDFYDVFEVAEGKLAVLIGDVSGHGIEAARAAALTKDVIHAFAHREPLPEQILVQTNSLLIQKSLAGFVSLFLGILDTDTLHLRYACAGHPDALLRRNSGEILPLRAASPPLGVFEDASWKLGEVDLEPGDLLFLYTDGLIEARGNPGFFGEQRLRELLGQQAAVERLPYRILDEVLSFSEGILRDDLAMLALLLTAPRKGG